MLSHKTLRFYFSSFFLCFLILDNLNWPIFRFTIFFFYNPACCLSSLMSISYIYFSVKDLFIFSFLIVSILINIYFVRHCSHSLFNRLMSIWWDIVPTKLQRWFLFALWTYLYQLRILSPMSDLSQEYFSIDWFHPPAPCARVMLFCMFVFCVSHIVY